MIITIDHIREALLQHFGYTQFLPGQEKVICRLLEGKNALVVMPTGAGKSLCYQLPALLLEGTVLVVSPLIALMKDQVDQLYQNGIECTYINSSITPDEIASRLFEVRQGKYKLVYVAPERFYSKSFMYHLQSIKISLFAIDEAHCISEWGHDFRPSYLRLQKVVEFLKPNAVAALTATATHKVREDISGLFGFTEEDQVITGFHRPNLFLMVDRIDKEKKRLVRLKEILTRIPGSIIIYASTRKVVDKITTELVEAGCSVTTYHAGLADEDRKNNQEQFLSGNKRIIVCTNAFGMGINKKDVRAVIHFNLPGSVEAYYQEAGRAGRDGKRAFGILLFGAGDRYLQEFFIQGNYPERDVIQEVYNILKNENQEVILKTFDGIAECMPGKINEMAVSSVLRIFEEHNIIEKLSEKQHRASLRMLTDIDGAFDMLPARAEIQRLVIANLVEIYAASIQDGIQCNLDVLASQCSIQKESLLRTIKTLQEKGILDYTPPFRGRGIRLLNRELDSENLPIDFDALAQRADQEYQKVREIEGYAYKNICRHRYLLHYFGDTSSVQDCKNCDICAQKNNQPATTQFEREVKKREEPELNAPIPEKKEQSHYNNSTAIIENYFLDLVKFYPARFGQKVFIDILKGSRNQLIKKWRLTDAPFYGKGAEYSRDDLENILSTLIIKGLISRQKGLYPVLTLTERGESAEKAGGFSLNNNDFATDDKTKQSVAAIKTNIIKAIIRYGLDKQQLVKESLDTSASLKDIHTINEELKKECMDYLHKKYMEEL
ncbi:ATP-dependent DNA helicase RecQ [bacterium]|nr:ATP-dependent DNA helicase RecQ [bacterium]MCP5462365.1 ATP-dependent DNA helicase RecQ [bacterium]